MLKDDEEVRESKENYRKSINGRTITESGNAKNEGVKSRECQVLLAAVCTLSR